MPDIQYQITKYLYENGATHKDALLNGLKKYPFVESVLNYSTLISVKNDIYELSNDGLIYLKDTFLIKKGLEILRRMDYSSFLLEKHFRDEQEMITFLKLATEVGFLFISKKDDGKIFYQISMDGEEAMVNYKDCPDVDKKEETW